MEQGLSKDSDRTTAKHEPGPSDSKFKALTASGPVPSPGFFFFFFRNALEKRLHAAFIIGTLRNYDGNGNGNGNIDVRQNNNMCNE